ncbi:uncharacterized protein PHACADRAFT_250774 [Phanerochaete carnosa HHB-10118-sp]|uniref:Uncharacterized protein n=1 Tax=Phanerochaete carnosa (strain HHB-10118-sp) TaxID=650164 RepID=K5WLA0_PHACS|nr:uncharacterized protein PHACADRAFT_250774 [Phanerochaete carnosa HHB-10118-sp]EKM59949.1 hypothetical protein PHACADRAFT_250774 [Phanerochaete carnosa HHB-10118-sp]
MCSIFLGYVGCSNNDCVAVLGIHIEVARFVRKVANTLPMKEMAVKEVDPNLRFRLTSNEVCSVENAGRHHGLHRRKEANARAFAVYSAGIYLHYECLRYEHGRNLR